MKVLVCKHCGKILDYIELMSDRKDIKWERTLEYQVLCEKCLKKQYNIGDYPVIFWRR